MVKRRTHNSGIVGSNPAGRTIYYKYKQAPIAQQVERLFCNQQVCGSIPCGSKFKVDFGEEVCYNVIMRL